MLSRQTIMVGFVCVVCIINLLVQSVSSASMEPEAKQESEPGLTTESLMDGLIVPMSKCITPDAQQEFGKCGVNQVLVAMKQLLKMFSKGMKKFRSKLTESCTGPGSNLDPINNDTDHKKKEGKVDTEVTINKDDQPSDNTTIKDNNEDHTNDEDMSIIDELLKDMEDEYDEDEYIDVDVEDEYTDEVDEHAYVDVDDDDVDDVGVDDKVNKGQTDNDTLTSADEKSLQPIPTECPDYYRLVGGGCYYILSNPRDWRSWGTANAFCHSVNGMLASPQRFHMFREYLSSSFSTVFWVGGLWSSQDEGRWEWLNGEKITEDIWKTGYPSKKISRRCIYLESFSGYRAVNHYCGEKYPFICEAKLV